MRLTANNYYSQEANQAYFSASQIKSFRDCQARTMAEIRGEWERQPSSALLIGSYVDSYFEGTLDEFINKHPECFKRDGTLKSEYVNANEMIRKAESDPVFVEYTQGEKQRIFTGDLFGCGFKAKFDFYLPGKRICDLKTCKDLSAVYREGEGRVSFVEAYGYTLQMAIYKTLEGNDLPCYLACITKQSPPDLCVIEIPYEVMDTELMLLKKELPLYDAIKRGAVEAERCEKCEYCRATKKLTGPTSFYDIEGGM